MSGQGPSFSGLMSVKKKPGRGVHLTSQSKHILTSVRSYFEEEKRTRKSLMKNRPLDRTATATGISKTTIKRIYQTMTEDKEILTPTTATETARRELLSTSKTMTETIWRVFYHYPKTITSLKYYNCYNNYRQPSDLSDPHKLNR